MRRNSRKGVRLKHLKTITKLNGTTYTYYAKPGFKLVPLPRLPENHPDFVMAYSAAAQSAPKTPSVRGGGAKGEAPSVRW